MMGFWIQGTRASVDRIEQGATAANDILYEYGISGYEAYLAHQKKLDGSRYDKKLDAAWLLARNTCFERVFGEPCLWERGAKLIFR